LSLPIHVLGAPLLEVVRVGKLVTTLFDCMSHAGDAQAVLWSDTWCIFLECRFDYNNVIQGAAFLLAKQDPSTKDDYAKNIKDVMSLWLNGRSSITYTAKVLLWHWLSQPMMLRGLCHMSITLQSVVT
jgi:hypothetical protein